MGAIDMIQRPQMTRTKFRKQKLDSKIQGEWGSEKLSEGDKVSEMKHANWASEFVMILMIVIISLVVLLIIFGFFTQLITPSDDSEIMMGV